MLFDPASLTRFASSLPHLRSVFAALHEMAVFTREALGPGRLAWLRALPGVQIQSPMALVHASPQDFWRAPAATASDGELQSNYRPLGQTVVVYGHIHTPYVRSLPGIVAANSGSVGLPYDGDPRATYLLRDEAQPTIRRVEYDVDRELKELAASSLPHAGWIARTLQSARPQMP
jgi:diadenosine tetraphosphatase ApaH/serine/threonine PP2A family protein phosphatase